MFRNKSLHSLNVSEKVFAPSIFGKKSSPPQFSEKSLHPLNVSEKVFALSNFFRKKSSPPQIFFRKNSSPPQYSEKSLHPLNFSEKSLRPLNFCRRSIGRKIFAPPWVSGPSLGSISGWAVAMLS